MAVYHISDTEYFAGEEGVVIPKHIIEEHVVEEHMVGGHGMVVELQETDEKSSRDNRRDDLPV
jgi:hypothetical protein